MLDCGAQGAPLQVLSYAMDCMQGGTPKLFYTNFAERQAFMTVRQGFNQPFYQLPALNSYVFSPDTHMISLDCHTWMHPRTCHVSRP